MPGVLTYWHTLRHLRPIQFYGRAWFRLARPRIDLRRAPQLRPLYGRDWVRPARRRESLVGPGCFRLLNETRDLAENGWDDPALEKLWRYNLHYFDDLNAQGAAGRANWHQALLLRWVRENPPAIGTGWESYPTSLRIVNWIKWALGGSALPVDCVQSMAVQVRWLSRRLETHLLGNHLFSNAKALVFAGLFFEGPEAERWLEIGMRILKREVPEQILSDGGHFERSTMYHAMALEDMLDLCNATTAFRKSIPARHRSNIAGWRDRIEPMRGWLAAMCHPDGEISFFNDAAAGVAPAPIELDRYAAALGFSDGREPARGLTHLAASGYIRIEHSSAVAVLDVASVGPDYLPGHSHADTLSFELSLFGQRVFVNSGISCYGNSTGRLQQRGTAAHNTVVVDGENSSEVWGGFRVARRARPIGLQVARNGEFLVRCAHDGYRRLPGCPTHERRWSLGEGTLVVEDRILGSFRFAEARFHLHPSVRLAERDGNPNGEASVVLRLPQGQMLFMSVEGGVLRNEAAAWHPEFGRSEPNFCIVAHLNRSVLRTCIEWKRAV